MSPLGAGVGELGAGVVGVGAGAGEVTGVVGVGAVGVVPPPALTVVELPPPFTAPVPVAAVVLGRLDLHGKVVIADALHTVKATARLIHEGGGEFAFPLKENRRSLLDAVDALPWKNVPVAHAATGKGHGRVTIRTIQVLPAPEGLPFPHVSQVFLIERYVIDLHGRPVSAVAALGVAARPPGRRPPPAWPASSASNGRLSPCTGSATPLPGRQVPGQDPLRSQGHGSPPKPRNRSTPHGRAHRHHRGNPMGRTLHGQALHHPRTHIMILEWPWQAP